MTLTILIATRMEAELLSCVADAIDCYQINDGSQTGLKIVDQRPLVNIAELIHAFVAYTSVRVVSKLVQFSISFWTSLDGLMSFWFPATYGK